MTHIGAFLSLFSIRPIALFSVASVEIACVYLLFDVVKLRVIAVGHNGCAPTLELI